MGPFPITCVINILLEIRCGLLLNVSVVSLDGQNSFFIFLFFILFIFFFNFFFKFYFIFKLYITVLVLPNIKMNPPQVYMCSPS